MPPLATAALTLSLLARFPSHQAPPCASTTAGNGPLPRGRKTRARNGFPPCWRYSTSSISTSNDSPIAAPEGFFQFGNIACGARAGDTAAQFAARAQEYRHDHPLGVAGSWEARREKRGAAAQKGGGDRTGGGLEPKPCARRELCADSWNPESLCLA